MGGIYQKRWKFWVNWLRKWDSVVKQEYIMPNRRLLQNEWACPRVLGRVYDPQVRLEKCVSGTDKLEMRLQKGIGSNEELFVGKFALSICLPGQLQISLHHLSTCCIDSFHFISSLILKANLIAFYISCTLLGAWTYQDKVTHPFPSWSFTSNGRQRATNQQM